MANVKLKRNENIAGQFYVDSTCIDCGTCYWVAEETFERNSGMSAVYAQPQTAEDKLAAYRAVYSCPTNSIGFLAKEAASKQALQSFPYSLNEGVYHTGFHSESSFGAASYFVTRDDGNILFDSPRYTQLLVKKFEEMGGIHHHYLSHKDDVADTDKYWEYFRGSRHIHHDDANTKTKHYEELFIGEDEIKIADDLIMIPVPGHTKGSVVYLYQNKYLFTGDHLAYSHHFGHLYAFKRACWYDFSIQTKSMEKLLDYSFEYVLPGHGAPFRGSVKEVKESLEKCLKWMKE